MTVAAPTAVSYTPAGLTFDEPLHRYRHDGREQIGVTTALKLAGLIDTNWYAPGDASRGTRVAAAIELLHKGELGAAHIDAEVEPYFAAYLAFAETAGFRVDASEERLCDPALCCAGTLDLRGRFVEPVGSTITDAESVDVIDVKSGGVPPWVGYQVAGYVRLLPVHVARRCRRWVLQLRADRTFRLTPLTKRSDRDVFLAAVTIAQAKHGWL